MLVRATQKLLKTCHGVIALTVLESDQIGTGSGSLSAVLTSALYQVGITGDKPVIPGIVVQNSLLEAKGVFPNIAVNLAHSIANLLHDKLTPSENCEPIMQPPTKRVEVVTESVQDLESLLEAFRETLKVIFLHLPLI